MKEGSLRAARAVKMSSPRSHGRLMAGVVLNQMFIFQLKTSAYVKVGIEEQSKARQQGPTAVSYFKLEGDDQSKQTWIFFNNSSATR